MFFKTSEVLVTNDTCPLKLLIEILADRYYKCDQLKDCIANVNKKNAIPTLIKIQDFSSAHMLIFLDKFAVKAFVNRHSIKLISVGN